MSARIYAEYHERSIFGSVWDEKKIPIMDRYGLGGKG